MNILVIAAAVVAGLLLLLFLATQIGAAAIERAHAPAGSFATVNGTRMHYVHVPAPDEADLPPVVFLHGASGNLKDQMLPSRPLLEGRAELLYLDRPGHGWSGRGEENGALFGQARTITALMDYLGISDAIIVSHSFGAAVAAAFALEYPGRTRGLVFLSAASHPWPGGKTSWYYRIAARPLIGWVFAQLVSLPAGLARITTASTCVFAPNAVPHDYTARASIALVLRPRAFRANAIDVEGLYRHVSGTAPRYREIDAPTVVVSGDSDTVVYEEIHSVGLSRDIPGAELVWVRNLGHKPDWVAPELVVGAIERVSGGDIDLQAIASRLEARIAGQDFRPVEHCQDDEPVIGAGVER